MKRIIIVLMFLAAVSAVHVIGSSRAQQQAGPARAAKYSKVGVINLAHVLTKYEKIKQMGDSLKKEAEPFSAKKKELEKNIRDWMMILQEGKLKEQNLDKGRQIIIDCKRQLEDLETTFKTDVTGRYEENMAQAWQEVSDKVREHAEANGFHLILAYGEPEKAWPGIAELKRKMGAIDAGGINKVYSAAGVDVSAAVLTSLNNAFRAGQPVKGDEPR